MEPSRLLAEEYTAKALDYAEHWAPVIRPMALPVLERLPLAGARLVLDVGCGIGTLVPALRAAAPEALVVGVDRAEGMLRLARRTHALACALMDAQRLALHDAVFDAALLAFVLFHIPRPLEALREPRRVLRPGGAVGVVTWGDDPGVPGLAVWPEELDNLGAAPEPRDASVMQHAAMDTPSKVAALLREAGFDGERLWCERFAHRFEMPALLEVQVRCGSAGRRLASLEPGRQAKCLRRVRARLERFGGDELIYRPEVVFAVAQTPPASLSRIRCAAAPATPAAARPAPSAPPCRGR
jgi:SAM-dependent methyltransferase